VGINFTTSTAQIYNALHMQGKKGDFCYLGAWPLCPLLKSPYGGDPRPHWGVR